MAFSWSNVFNPLGFGEDEKDTLRKGYDAAQSTLDKAKKNMKSASQLQQEGRGYAGQAAADKAGQAKKAATAAAKMSGAGRLASATKGAAAAADASAQGYSESASEGASLANSAQQQQLALATQQADLQKSQADREYEAEQRRKDRLTQGLATIGGMFASSDGGFKNYKKHTYVRER